MTTAASVSIRLDAGTLRRLTAIAPTLVKPGIKTTRMVALRCAIEVGLQALEQEEYERRAEAGLVPKDNPPLLRPSGKLAATLQAARRKRREATDGHKGLSGKRPSTIRSRRYMGLETAKARRCARDGK